MDHTIQNKIKKGLELAGARYWTASLGPAAVGTFLPFWLRSEVFIFRPFPAIEFLIASLLLHAGFTFLFAWFEKNDTVNGSKGRILLSALVCICSSCLIGYHINLNLELQPHVFKGIFPVFGCSALFVGVLYVVPPLTWHRQIGGEIVISYSLGLLPLIGAYLVQVGDITRTVYLAALPVIVLTVLWVWINEIMNYYKEENTKRKTGKKPRDPTLCTVRGPDPLRPLLHNLAPCCFNGFSKPTGAGIIFPGCSYVENCEADLDALPGLRPAGQGSEACCDFTPNNLPGIGDIVHELGYDPPACNLLVG